MAKDNVIYKPDTELLMLLNKMEKPERSEKDMDELMEFSSIYSETNKLSVIRDSNKDILELFPDIEIAKETVISNIVGGIDMYPTTLNYSLSDTELPSLVKTGILGIIEKHISKVYKLEDKQYDMVEEALFLSGAYCDILIPENVISTMIKAKETLGDIESILDNTIANSTDFENIVLDNTDTNISIGTNLGIIQTDDVLEMDIESSGTDKVRSLKKLFLKKNIRIEGKENISLDTIDSVKRSTLSIPLRLKVPTESIIPITSPFDKSKHFKYILLLDEKGFPLKASKTIDTNNETMDNVIKAALNAKQDNTDKTSKLDIPEYAIFKGIRESILNKVSSGKRIRIDTDMLNDVFFMAFSRHLSKQKTRLVIIDAENVNYLAFDYRENGTGKSIIEKLGPLVSMRAILLMTRMNANIDNSITKFKVTADLDPKNPRYKKEAATVVQSAYNSRSSNMLYGVRDFKTLNDLISRAGIYFEINHPKLPQTKIDFENVNTDKREPDTDFYDSLKKDTARVFGLTPENIEDASSDEFATGLKIKNALFARRIGPKRKRLSEFFTSYINKVMINDGLLRSKVDTYVKKNLKEIINLSKFSTDEKKELKKFSELEQLDFFYYDILDNIKCELPDEKPLEDETLNTAYNSYKDRLEEIMEIMFSSDSLPDEFISITGEKLDSIRGAIYHTLLRKWMSDHNYMPEVLEILDTNEYGEFVSKPAEEFIEYLRKVLQSNEILFSKDLVKILKKADKKMNKFEDRMNSEDPEPEEPESEEPGDAEPNEEIVDVPEEPVDEEPGEEI